MRSNAKIPLRNTDKEKKKVLLLLNKIKVITKRPHIHNLIEALEDLYQKLKTKES